MSLKLSQELKQKQKLSHLQIQTIQLIELPIQELEQRIRKELDENPVLDEDAPATEVAETQEEAPRQVSLSDYKEDDSVPSYKLYVNNQGKDERPQYNTFSVQQSFQQSLQDQLGFRNLSEQETAVANFIIGSLDEDGYLRRDLDSIVDDIAFRTGIETDYDEVLRLLKVIQEFEPAGVGARDLRECLLLQLRDCDDSQASRDARDILEKYFQDFAAKHFDKIKARLGLDSQRLKDAMMRIRKLNPQPGGQLDDSYSAQTQQVIPDFLLREENGQLQLSMPRFNIPELHVNKRYSDIMEEGLNSKDQSKKEAAMFVKQKLESAKWFVEAIKQRQNTLMKTMQAIIDYQQDFFMDGEESHLRPMVLKDIAAVTGFDISTISRVANSKYIETPFGVFPLKYFFTEGMENSEGEEVSTREIKNALKEIIDAEDKDSPWTDDQLVNLLGEKGYKVARRTVAKYRDQLKIPTARLRKEII